MKIAVVGAAGAIGGAVVRAAATSGHEVIAIARSALLHPRADVTIRFADVVTRRGLREALLGAEVVIDAVNSPKPDHLARGTLSILDTARALGVRHYVGVSIVGCDRVPLSYFRAKAEQERLVAAAPLPWSLLRATQLHDYLAKMFDKSALFGIHLVPSQVMVQPVSVDEVAAALVAAAVAPPAGRLADFAGPELLRVGDAFARWRDSRGRWALPLPLPIPGAAGRALVAGALCNPQRAVGQQSFADWLKLRATSPTARAAAAAS